MKSNYSSIINSLIIMVLGITGAWLVLHVTRYGIGVLNDSAFYVGAARNLAAGQGLGLYRPHIGYVLLTVFPPLNSLVLAGLEVIGLDMVAAARWMNAILFGLTTIISGGIFLWKWRSPLPAFLVAALIAFSPSLIEAHVWLMSEPLYYFLAAVSLTGLAISLTEFRWHWLTISAVAAALAALDRYSGLALIAAALLVLLFQPGITRNLRLKQTTLYGLISLIPNFIWFLIARMNGTFAGREPLSLVYTIPRIKEIIPNLKLTLISWIPYSDKFSFISDPHQYKPFWFIMILVFLGLVLWALWLMWKTRKNKGEKIEAGVWLIISPVFMACHMLVFSVASLFLNNSPAIGDRNFAPLLFAGYFILGSLAAIFLSVVSRKYFVTVLLVSLCGLIIILNGIDGINAVKSYPPDARGYNNIASRQSPIFKAIRDLPESLLIVCNDPNVVLFHSNRYPYPLLEEYTLDPEWDFPVYGKGRNRDDKGQVIFDRGQAALVLLPDAYWELDAIYFDKTPERMAGLTAGLYLYYSGPDGKIYLKDESVLNPR